MIASFITLSACEGGYGDAIYQAKAKGHYLPTM